MKTFFKLSIFAFLFLIVTSCSKSDDTKSNEPASTSEFIKFKCNGTLYEFSEPEIINSLSKSILAFETNVKRVTLFVPLNVAAGTFPITDAPSNVNSYGVFVNIIALGLEGSATSGSMTISSVTGDNVKGTFSCTINNSGQTFAITEGSFNVGG